MLRGDGDCKRALDLINVARVIDAELAKSAGADELQDEVKRAQVLLPNLSSSSYLI